MRQAMIACGVDGPIIFECDLLVSQSGARTGAVPVPRRS